MYNGAPKCHGRGLHEIQSCVEDSTLRPNLHIYIHTKHIDIYYYRYEPYPHGKDIINLTINTGIIPAEWKTAIVTPIRMFPQRV